MLASVHWFFHHFELLACIIFAVRVKAADHRCFNDQDQKRKSSLILNGGVSSQCQRNFRQKTQRFHAKF
jgi:hypothetical protein